MVSSPKYKPGDYIVFSNDSEYFIGVVTGDSGMGGAYEGWYLCEFYYPTKRTCTCEPNHLKPASDAEVCLLRMEGSI